MRKAIGIKVMLSEYNIRSEIFAKRHLKFIRLYLLNELSKKIPIEQVLKHFLSVSKDKQLGLSSTIRSEVMHV